jgi:hypothetical protein
MLFFILINFSYAQPAKQAAMPSQNISLHSDITFLKKVPSSALNIPFYGRIQNEFFHHKNQADHEAKMFILLCRQCLRTIMLPAIMDSFVARN